MKRRDFLKLGGLAASSTLLSACTVPRPRSYYVPYVEQPEDVLPGVDNWYATACGQCEAGCGIMARVIEGRAVKLEGNPAHPVNRGKLCAMGQSGLQVLYHPDRVRGPMRRKGDRGQASFEPIKWDDALSLLAQRLVPEVGKGTVTLVSRPLNGTLGLVLDRFARAAGGRGPVTLDIQGQETLVAGLRDRLGMDRPPHYDLANSRFLINFGADLFETWLSPVNYSLQYGHMRQGRPGIRGRMVHVEPRMSLTAGSADRWIPVPPGYEGMLALSLAHVLVTEQLAVPGFEAWGPALAAYAPEQVAATLEVSARTIRELARDFATSRPALAIAGGPALAHTNGVQTASAVHALNMLVGSVGVPGGLLASPPAPVRQLNAFAPGAFSEWTALIARMRAGRVQVLLVHQADPAYLLPKRMGFREALANVPFIVSFGSFVDDTTAHADLILPDHTYLESWGLVAGEPSPGVPVLTSRQPVVSPVFDTRPTPDVLISLGKALGGSLAAAMPWASYVDLVRSTWASVAPQQPALWSDVRQAGLWSGKAAGPGALRGKTSVPAVPAPTFTGSPQEFPFAFYPYVSPSLHDGRAANLPWQQELPDPMTAGVWSSWVELNPATALRLGVAEGDAVQVRSPHGTLEARVHLYPGLHPTVVAMPMGQGHRAYGRYAAGRGSNPMDVVAPTTVPGSGGLAWAATRVSLERTPDAPSFTKVERRPWPPEHHDSPNYVSLEDLVSKQWPWDDRAGGPHGGTSR